ncbi:MAG: ferrochelatase [Sandaracinus sp.]|nr:ferrochelatase [Sandaracinus sp.]
MSLRDPHRARARLVALDDVLDARGPRETLAPDRERATSLATLFDRASDLDPALHADFGLALERVAKAMHVAFPENLFWDLDALAHRLARTAREEGAHVMTAQSALVASMQHLFGRETPIAFQYTHDFVYGFDWAKWVRREPTPRVQVGPFDRVFLDSMWQRGHELLALIANDDAEYPKLRGERARNPFGFARDPEHERRIYRDLVENDLVPVQAWDPEPRCQWDRPFRELREERAKALGLPGRG